MFEMYKKIYGLLDARERRRGALVLALLVLVAFAQVLGVASIMPFIAVLANPEVIQTNQYLAAAYHWLGFTSQQAFLHFLGLVFLVLLVGSLVLEAVGSWAQLRFSHNRNYQWSSRLVGGYLRQPYEWFLNRHSSDLATAVLGEVSQVVTSALFPAMQAIAHILVAVFLMILLIVVDPVLALAIGGVLGGGFGLISMALRKRLKRIGAERRLANKSRFLVVQEAFGGIKDVKVAGLEESFVRRFRQPSQILAKRQISAGLIAQMPTFAMQALLFGGMMLALLYLMATYGGFQEAIPIAALYAFAAYRLMPAIKNIYKDVSQLRFSEAALNALCTDFATLQTFPELSPSPAETGAESRIRLQKHLQLVDVVYRYPDASRTALAGLTLRIPAFTTIGLVGATGSGKTTTVDLILGLLRPQSGRLVVDGEEIKDDQLRSWQRSVGYVPQQIFLADDSVAGNIAFGSRPKDIDIHAVERAASVANLHSFVVNDLPEGYQTHVGERGVRLSGGQRQRIGIARALYHDPDILILDEATSALDNLTEQAVMEAVHNLGSRKTIVLIAHRLSTVKNCDRIYLLEQGCVIGEGTYDELIKANERFRAMAEAV
jgi:ATP-binding cassette, subfamily B, bacterial PglK